MFGERLVDRRSLGSQVFVRRTAQSLEVAPGLLRAVEARFTAAAHNHVADDWGPWVLLPEFLDLPKLDTIEGAQLPPQRRGRSGPERDSIYRRLKWPLRGLACRPHSAITEGVNLSSTEPAPVVDAT